MDLRQLTYFLAIVDHGGVNKAAEALFVAQPSVSQALHALERDLNSTLFVRVGRKLVLTTSGEALVPAARHVLNGIGLARSLVDAAEGLRSGRLLISSTSSQSAHPLTPLITGFQHQHPGVSVTVRAAKHREDVIASLYTGDAELGLIGRPEHEAIPKDLDALSVESQRYLCIARDPGDLPSVLGTVRPADLVGARLIVGQNGTEMRRAANQVLAMAEGSTIAVEIEHREALIPLILAGAGVAIVTEAFMDLALATGLAFRALDVPGPLSVDLLKRQGTVSPAAQAFWDAAKLWTLNHSEGCANP
ncbi:LysR family transcriptional regulator [Glutamicibacter sp. JL.03c]|uniref:LysR family transcriptional regulator n=1 Tax=Glutamicibacter sp. JL.03c TaxID=2984842 RepID=UPI0021F6C4BE|nr:LysR family transcriptional regulator [Glutamicibacter sp. JL.03c]UYQ77751.1 LysR family transcriptional regulator [Glutamicibacter sp. JL.03c]